MLSFPSRLTRHSQSDPMTAAHRTTLLLTLFALAMAPVEASLVAHLRSIYYPDDALMPAGALSLRKKDLGHPARRMSAEHCAGYLAYRKDRADRIH